MKKDDFNQFFKDNSINLEIIDEKDKEFIFSSGISENKIKLYRRFRNNRYLRHFEEIYGFDFERKTIIETNIRKQIASSGGKAVQKKYGQIIKQNLNTGIPWNKGKRNVSIGWCRGKNKDNDERLKALSEKRTGPGNPMYGRKTSDSNKKKKSLLMKQRILDGSFTPNIKNSLTHWQSSYNGKRFRSSWEALFYKFNQDYEYEKQRLVYLLDGEEKIYLVDFVNHSKRHLVEIKPSIHRNSKKQKAKEQALKEFCLKNKYYYSILDEEWFKSRYTISDIEDFEEETFNRLKAFLL